MMESWESSPLAAGLVGALGDLFLRAERGALGRWRRARRQNERVRSEDVLKHLYEAEINGQATSPHTVAGATGLRLDGALAVLARLEAQSLVVMEGDAIRLTPPGRELGLHVLRAHRLWESYLADRTGFPEVEWHDRAHDLEHGVSPGEVDALAAGLQHPTHDPHGDPIPTAAGEFLGPQGIPLPSAPLGRTLRVLHIEDEPAAVYAQLLAVGLHPGAPVRLLDVSPHRVRVSVGGAEQVLARLFAASVSVVPVAEGKEGEESSGEPLDALRVGEEGRVLAISRRCRGAERRRLLDLGILPGTIVRVEMRSPSGDPTAYRVRDAFIALRAVQAQLIRIERIPGRTAEAA